MSRAGHLPPALTRPGERAAFVNLPPGMPLGAGVGDNRYQTTRLRIPRGSTVVLYTDGLTESPSTDIGTGMAHLARTLITAARQPRKAACDTLLTDLVCQPADDIAILMART